MGNRERLVHETHREREVWAGSGVAGYPVEVPRVPMVEAPSKLPKGERAKLVRRVLRWMAEGHTLAVACTGVGLKPGTVRNWLVNSPAWWAEYVRVRALQAQAFADEAIQVARDSTGHSTAQDRTLIETLKWAAAKANPAEFGDRQTVEHQGSQRLEVVVVEDAAPAGTQNVPNSGKPRTSGGYGTEPLSARSATGVGSATILALPTKTG